MKWDLKIDRNIAALDNECSRYQFTYPYYDSKKGEWLRNYLKTFATKTLFFVRRQIMRHWDVHAFQFEDPRLYLIKQFTAQYFAENMEQRKQDILNCVVDIVLWYLKEDIFYRVRFIDLLVKFIEWYKINNTWHGDVLFGLDEPELNNLKEWKGK